MKTNQLQTKGYKPEALLDHLIWRLALKNDRALSAALRVKQPVVSNIRHRRLPIGDSMLVRMHDASDLPIRQLRLIGGIPE